MGAWGAGVFDNDTACDWAHDFGSKSSLDFVAATLDRVLAVGDEYLESDAACEGLAAAEVVARLRGKWGVRNAYSEVVDTWVEAHPTAPSPALVAKARAAIDRILSGSSELLDLWSESHELARWRAAVADLRSRVAS